MPAAARIGRRSSTSSGNSTCIAGSTTKSRTAAGRSAAFWTESYGGPRVQPLTTASFDYLSSHGFLAPRGALTLARASERAERDAFVAEFAALGVRVEALERAALEVRLPGLAEEWQHGAWEPDCTDIDVAGLHQHWLAEAARQGAQLCCRAALAGAEPCGEGWHLRLADGKKGDQKRIVTPREARDAGASVLVIGRPIRSAEDPVAAARAIEATL